MNDMLEKNAPSGISIISEAVEIDGNVIENNFDFQGNEESQNPLEIDNSVSNSVQAMGTTFSTKASDILIDSKKNAQDDILL